MRRSIPQILIALFLIFGGLLILLQNLGLLPSGNSLFWALGFGVGGAIFLYVYLIDRQNWWALIPSAALFAVGLTVALASTVGGLSGAIFMGVLSLGFVGTYLSNRDNWWAIVPAGAILSVAGVILVSEIVEDDSLVVSVLFLGLAATFAVLSLIPTRDGRMQWPKVPALVLALLAIFAGLVFSPSARLLWPLFLIVGGVLIIGWALLKGRSTS